MDCPLTDNTTLKPTLSMPVNEEVLQNFQIFRTEASTLDACKYRSQDTTL